MSNEAKAVLFVQEWIVPSVRSISNGDKEAAIAAAAEIYERGGSPKELSALVEAYVRKDVGGLFYR